MKLLDTFPSALLETVDKAVLELLALTCTAESILGINGVSIGIRDLVVSRDRNRIHHASCGDMDMYIVMLYWYC